jgi:hypothetical protein
MEFKHSSDSAPCLVLKIAEEQLLPACSLASKIPNNFAANRLVDALAVQIAQPLSIKAFTETSLTVQLSCILHMLDRLCDLHIELCCCQFLKQNLP